MSPQLLASPDDRDSPLHPGGPGTPDPHFWAGRRVFLTGHTGFIGGWLGLWLTSWGARVTGYSLDPPTVPSLFGAARVGDGMTDLRGDIRNEPDLARALRTAAPDVVFHLAAQPIVLRSYRQPVETYATNVLGTVHLLQAVRETPSARAVVVVTSDKCYATQEPDAVHRETDPLGGHDPYSSSKGCAELVARAFARSYFDGTGTGVATARAGNVIGGGDWAPDRLVPDFFRASDARETLHLRHPEAVRPWQHVLEPVRGLLMLAERLHADPDGYAGPFNFGPSLEDCRPVGWLIGELARRLSHPVGVEGDAAARPQETSVLRLDCSKAWARLGWRPRWDLARALDEVVSWHEQHVAGADMRGATLAQIARYRDDAGAIQL